MRLLSSTHELKSEEEDVGLLPPGMRRRCFHPAMNWVEIIFDGCVWVDGSMPMVGVGDYAWLDGWVNGWMDGRMDGWMVLLNDRH